MPQPVCGSEMYWSGLAIIFSFHFSPCPFVCKWYPVEFKCFGSKMLHNTWKNLLTTCTSLFGKKWVYIPYSIVHISIKRDGECDAVVFDVFLNLVQLSNRSVITSKNSISFQVPGSAPRMNIASSSSGAPTRNICKRVGGSLLASLRLSRPLTIAYSSLSISCKIMIFCILSYTHLSTRCPATLS